MLHSMTYWFVVVGSWKMVLLDEGQEMAVVVAIADVDEEADEDVELDAEVDAEVEEGIADVEVEDGVVEVERVVVVEEVVVVVKVDEAVVVAVAVERVVSDAVELLEPAELELDTEAALLRTAAVVDVETTALAAVDKVEETLEETALDESVDVDTEVAIVVEEELEAVDKVEVEVAVDAGAEDNNLAPRMPPLP